MDDLNVANSSLFYGRSVAYDGEYHVVQSSSPPCTNLHDLASRCGTVKYRLRMSHWDHFDTGEYCGDQENDAVLKFVPRKGMSPALKDDYEKFLKEDASITKHDLYFLDVAEINDTYINVTIAGSEYLEIPREAIQELSFVGLSSGSEKVVTASFVFSPNSSGELIRGLVDAALSRLDLNAEVHFDPEAFVLDDTESSVFDKTFHCAGPNGKPSHRGWLFKDWKIARIKLRHTNFLRVDPLEIWDDARGSVIRTVVTPWAPGQPFGIPINNAYFRATIQGTKR